MDFTAARHAMVDCQVRPSDVTNYGIIDAMLSVPREQFVPKAQRAVAYSEAEIKLSDDRVMLPPRTFAKMLEQSRMGPGDFVLDLAAGTGYSAAVFARLCAGVIALEADDGLLKQMNEAMAALDIDSVVTLQGDLASGDAAHGPYDVIFINGAVETVSEALLDQLKIGGRLVAVFVEGAVGQCRVLVRSENTSSSRYAFDAWAPILKGFERDVEFAF
ncbi:MAG: protein-L-isoaspartate O-methyltransferase [Pseudomonadota bacterium]